MSLGERLFWIALVIVAYGYASRYDETDELIVQSASYPQAAHGQMNTPLPYTATVTQSGDGKPAKTRHYAPPNRERNF